MSYIGIPPFGQTIRSVTNITATASQTTFNIVGGYQAGYSSGAAGSWDFGSGSFVAASAEL